MAALMKCKKCGNNKPMRDIMIISATFPLAAYGAEGEMASTCMVKNCVLRCQGLRIVALPCEPERCLPAIRSKCEGWKA